MSSNKMKFKVNGQNLVLDLDEWRAEREFMRMREEEIKKDPLHIGIAEGLIRRLEVEGYWGIEQLKKELL